MPLTLERPPAGYPPPSTLLTHAGGVSPRSKRDVSANPPGDAVAVDVAVGRTGGIAVGEIGVAVDATDVRVAAGVGSA